MIEDFNADVAIVGGAGAATLTSHAPFGRGIAPVAARSSV